MAKIPYRQWLAQVAGIVEDQIGMSIRDLPDAPYKDMYDEGLEPADMADIVIDAAAEY